MTLSSPVRVIYPHNDKCFVPWQDYVTIPDVALIPLDTRVTTITPNASTMQVARGNVVSDADGNRQATILVPGGTTAQIFLANGTTQPVSNLNVRLTEYTVGSNGPTAMSAQLPPATAYTYAVEIRADESIAKIAGRDALLSQTIYFYVENFLNIPVGKIVPVGYYDNDKATWVPSDNGKVIKLLSVTGGFADLDVTGDNVADTGAALSDMGITDAERIKLAGLYAPGQTLWRAPITHFSSWDLNFAGGFPLDATGPAENNAGPVDQSVEQDSCEASGSIIECENQVLGERVAVAGTPYTLNYRSDRVPGRLSTLRLNLGGPTLPASLLGIRVFSTIAGQSQILSHPPLPNQTHDIVANHQDVYGRTVQGGQLITGSIDYEYPLLYMDSSGTNVRSFNRVQTSNTVLGSRNLPAALSMPFVGIAGEGITDARALGIGGWTLSDHHFYDNNTRVMHTGDGRRRRAAAVGNIIKTIGGTGVDGITGDGGPALQATLNPLAGLAIGPDGTVYFCNYSEGALHLSLLRRISPGGSIFRVAGLANGAGYNGDNILAINARLSCLDVAVAPDFSIYIADLVNRRVRRVNANGVISTVAGNGTNTLGADDVLATQTGAVPTNVAIGTDGSFYFRDQILSVSNGISRIRQVSTDGIISTVVDCPKTDCASGGLAVGADGSVYFDERASGAARIKRLRPDGATEIFAGSGQCQVGVDGLVSGVAATQANICNVTSISLAPDGSLYFADSNSPAIAVIKADGIIAVFAGKAFGSLSDGILARDAKLDTVHVRVGFDGAIYLSTRAQTSGPANARIRRISAPLPGFTNTSFIVASQNGSEVYSFDAEGRHVNTKHGLTGGILKEFTYDNAGRLASITEKTGGTDNVTTIQRDINGNPTKIVGPFGHETSLAVDANGFLSSIANPGGDTIQLLSTSGGLITSFTDPRNKTSTYSYDSNGRLAIAADPAGGSQALVRTSSPGQYQVTRTTGLKRTSTYKVEELPGNDRRRTITAPDNTQIIAQENSSAGNKHVTAPDNTLIVEQLGSDPRFAMQAPFMTSQTLTPPVGPTTVTTSSKTATLSNASDPSSLTSLTESSAINGRITTMTYTQSTKTGVSTSPAGRTSSVTIDSLGRLASAQISGLNATNVVYDARGRVATITRGSGPSARTTSFGYDAAGLVSSMTDPLGRVTQINYDSADRMTSKVFPDGRIVNIAYDAAGNIATLTPPGRPAYTFAYSDRNELTALTPPAVAGSGPNSYTLNLDKQLTSASRPDNRSVLLDYDAGGRVSSRSYSASGVTTGTDTFTYDSAGRLSTIEAASGVNLQYSYIGALMTGITWTGAIAGDVEFAYDNSLRLVSESVDGGDTVNFTYDNDDYLIGVGGLTITRNPQHGLATAAALGNVSTSATYTGFGEVDTYSATANGSPIFSNTFTYDKLGRITQKVETIGGVTSTYDYTYSLADQLTGVSKDSVAIESYAYDDNGNRASATLGGIATPATYDNQDRLLTYGAVTFGYSGAGDLQSKNNGGQITSYQYDQIGNLLSVTLPGGTVVSYVVDGRGRRVGKKINNVFTKRFLYGDALRPVAELDGTGTLINRFVYGDGDVPAYMTKAGISYRMVTDHVGNVRLVVNATTGAIAQRIDYDSFGNVTFDSSPGFQPFGFAGGLYDQDTGLVRFGARDYTPATGRWTIKDPILFDGGDLNLYAYVGNNPVNFTDPGGLDPFDDLLDPEKRGEVFKKINPTVCPQNNCPATANRMFDYLSRKDTSAAACLPPGKRYRFEGNYKGVHFTDLVDPLPGGHGTFVQVWGKRTGGESDHHFTIVNIQGKNYIIDAYGGGREPRSDIEKYFKEQGFDLGGFQVRIVPCESGNCR